MDKLIDHFIVTTRILFGEFKTRHLAFGLRLDFLSATEGKRNISEALSGCHDSRNSKYKIFLLISKLKTNSRMFLFMKRANN